MLFALVIDKLNSLRQHATLTGILKRLTPRHVASGVSLFADDMVIFCHTDAHELDPIKELLRLFGNASKLSTNFLKCSATPIRCGNDELATIESSLACPMWASLSNTSACRSRPERSQLPCSSL